MVFISSDHVPSYNGGVLLQRRGDHKWSFLHHLFDLPASSISPLPVETFFSLYY